MSACDLGACQEGTQPTVSHHPRVLREAGLVRADRRGTFIHYSLQPVAIERLAALIHRLPAPRPEELLAPGAGHQAR